MGDQTENAVRREITLRSGEEATAVLGQFDRNLNAIREHFPGVRVLHRGNKVVIAGEPADVERVGLLFDRLRELVEAGSTPDLHDVEYLSTTAPSADERTRPRPEAIRATRWGEAIRPKTAGQMQYVQAIRDHDVVFAIGPSGTGKTYLAVAVAIEHLKKGRVHRLVLTRPAVEAGEELGFLPGDIEAKVSPYLRPLYDALFDMIPHEDVQLMMSNGKIEIAPLAFMRGRTLNNSFIILDEAQNTTPTQMKMFLTRLGFNSRAVITGDITQIDLERGQSGLKGVQSILCDIPGIAFVYLDRRDVVRHPLVKRIIEAYEKAEKQGT